MTVNPDKQTLASNGMSTGLARLRAKRKGDALDVVVFIIIVVVVLAFFGFISL